MWKMLSEWLLAGLNMARELDENRKSIRQIEAKLRDLEETIKLLAMEQRHARDMESSEREKLLLRLQQELTKFKALPQARTKKARRKGSGR